jgi:hypothetical protein
MYYFKGQLDSSKVRINNNLILSIYYSYFCKIYIGIIHIGAPNAQNPALRHILVVVTKLPHPAPTGLTGQLDGYCTALHCAALQIFTLRQMCKGVLSDP